MPRWLHNGCKNTTDCNNPLLGGATRAVEPVPVLLHSGDVLIMSGKARRFFHGVPCVLDLGMEGRRQEPAADGDCSLDHHPKELLERARNVMKRARINLSVRHV